MKNYKNFIQKNGTEVYVYGRVYDVEHAYNLLPGFRQGF